MSEDEEVIINPPRHEEEEEEDDERHEEEEENDDEARGAHVSPPPGSPIRTPTSAHTSPRISPRTPTGPAPPGRGVTFGHDLLIGMSPTPEIGTPLHPTPTRSSLAARRGQSVKELSKDSDTSRSKSSMSCQIMNEQAQILQQESIQTLLKLIRKNPHFIFSNSKLDKLGYLQPYEIDRPRPDQFIDLYHTFYNEGFTNFDKDTYEILRLYIDACLTVFDELLNDKDRNFPTQIRLLTISLIFGIDRALTSLKNKDKLFNHFHCVPADYYHTRIYDSEELRQKAQNLPIAREHYIDYFRTDFFDPANSTNVPVFGPHGKTFIPVTTHSFTSPITPEGVEKRTSTFVYPETLKYSKPSTPRTDKRQEKQRPQPSDFDRMTPTSDSDEPHKTRRNPSGRSNIQQQETQQQFCNSPNPDWNPNQRSTPTHQQPLHSTLRLSKRPSKRYSSTPYYSDEESSESDSSMDPKKPRKPLFISDAESFHGEQLSNAGTVYDKKKYTRIVPKKSSSFIDSIIANIRSLGLSEEQECAILGTSLGVAQSINSFTKEGQKHQHQPIIRPMSPPPSDLDLRVNSFDYNNLGKTPEEILGKRFSRLKFPSEAVRQSTLRSIFQKIVDDPVTPHYARVIALGQLGQIDGPKNTKEEIEQILSRTISRLDTHKDPDIIPPPQLGENSLDGRTLKTLQTRLGIEDRVSFDEISTSLFKSILHNLSSVITSARLRESEAYALMKRITKGVSYETVQIHELEHRTPFIDYWITIQKTQRRSCSPREYEKKLKAVLSSDKIDNLEKALNEIMIYTFKIHEKEPDPAYRRMLTQRECLKNFRTFIRTHFAPYFSQINTCYMDRLRQMALENNDPSFTNENIYHHQKSQIFQEVACDILSQVEPEEPPQRSRERQHNIYAISDPSIQQKTSQPSQQQTQERSPRQNYQQQGSFQHNNYRSNTPAPRPPSRGNQLQPRAPSRAMTPGNRPNYNCHLCNRRGHSYRDCRTYPNEERGPSFCDKCGGTHKSECKTHGKQRQQNNQMASIQQPETTTPFQPNHQYPQQYPQQQYRNNGYNNRPRSQNGYNNGPQGQNTFNYPSQNNQNIYRGYQRPRSHNGYRNTNFQPRPFLQTQQQYNNYRPMGQQQYNNYPQYRNQDQYRNLQRDHQRNDGRKSQSGYQQRPFFNNNRNNPNTERLGPRLTGYKPPYNGQYEPHYQQMASDPPRNKTQDPPQKQNGLGNNGYQPIPITARLAAIAGYDPEPESDNNQE